MDLLVYTTNVQPSDHLANIDIRKQGVRDNLHSCEVFYIYCKYQSAAQNVFRCITSTRAQSMSHADGILIFCRCCPGP